MIDRVIVPVDGSLLSEVGLKIAAQVMPETASLTILTVIPSLSVISYSLPELASPVGEYQDSITEMLADATAYVRRLAQDSLLAPHHVDTAVQIGDPAQSIIDYAQKVRADLIVMTTHGRSGLSRWVFGSVSNKVVSASPCPILIVPQSQLGKYLEPNAAEMIIH